MVRKCLGLLVIVGVVMMLGAGVASAKAIKSEVAVTPSGTAKVMLNYCPDEAQVIVNVNASDLASETTYTVQVIGEDGLTVMATEEFTTKPDKSKGKVNGKGEPKKTKNFKSKGHVNIHIPVLGPPNLALWSVTITGAVAPEPPPTE